MNKRKVFSHLLERALLCKIFIGFFLGENIYSERKKFLNLLNDFLRDFEGFLKCFLIFFSKIIQGWKNMKKQVPNGIQTIFIKIILLSLCHFKYDLQFSSLFQNVLIHERDWTLSVCIQIHNLIDHISWFDWQSFVFFLD